MLKIKKKKEDELKNLGISVVAANLRIWDIDFTLWTSKLFKCILRLDWELGHTNTRFSCKNIRIIGFGLD